jgi:hypothetical protein
MNARRKHVLTFYYYLKLTSKHTTIELKKITKYMTINLSLKIG